MSEKILVLAEHRSGKVKGISWEAIGFGQKLASELNAEMTVVLLGHEIDALAADVSQRCGQPVLVASDPSLVNYTPEAYCVALSRILEEQSPLLLLMGHTYQAIDFAPRLATMAGRGFIPNCVDYQWDGKQVTFVRQVFNGKLNLQVGFKGSPPHLVSLQQGAFNAYEVQTQSNPKVVRLDVPLPPGVLKRKVLEVIQAEQGKVDRFQPGHLPECGGAPNPMPRKLRKGRGDAYGVRRCCGAFELADHRPARERGRARRRTRPKAGQQPFDRLRAGSRTP